MISSVKVPEGYEPIVVKSLTSLKIKLPVPVAIIPWKHWSRLGSVSGVGGQEYTAYPIPGLNVPILTLFGSI